MTDKTQVNIRVLEETKSRWDNALESPEYDSLTHLITLSVSNELSDDGRTQDASSGSGETAEVVRDDVVPALTQIQRSVEQLDSRIDQIETTVESQGPEYDIETAVIDVLPTTPEGVEKHDGPQSWAMTVDDIASELASRGVIIDKPDIRNAVDGLVESLGYIKKQEGRDVSESQRDTVYWRVE